MPFFYGVIIFDFEPFVKKVVVDIRALTVMLL